VQGIGQVRGDIAARLGRRADELPESMRDWPGVVGEAAFRTAAGDAMREGKWIKQVAIAEEVGRAVAPALADLPGTNLAEVVATLQQWSDGA
jgi:hypothetical protein